MRLVATFLAGLRASRAVRAPQDARAEIGRPGKAVISEAVYDTARSLRLDAVAAEVVSRLRGVGVRAILLKGPALAAWLYADGAVRPYGDVDLLVSVRDVKRAGRELRAIGFRRGQPGWQEISHSWWRRTDASTVDLHTSLFGVEAPAEELWGVLSSTTQSMRVGGAQVEVPNRPALAFHVALHAAQHGSEGGKPQRDLRRAVALATDDEWRAAADLATRLEAGPAFATGLSLDPGGAEVPERLGLSAERPVAIALHAQGARPLVLGLEHLATAHGVRARLRFLARKLVPSASYMRRHPGLARRGRAGLVLAYLWRPLWALLALPGAAVAWRHAHRHQTRIPPAS